MPNFNEIGDPLNATSKKAIKDKTVVIKMQNILRIGPPIIPHLRLVANKLPNKGKIKIVKYIIKILESSHNTKKITSKKERQNTLPINQKSYDQLIYRYDKNL